MSELYFFHPSWPVLYEDNHLLALYKPAGLLVQGDQTGEDSLLDLGKAWLKVRYAKPGQVFLGMVHRLDRPVAGVVLFCRTSKAAARMSAQFRTGTPRKIYLAVVEGRMTSAGGRLIQHIERRDERSSRIVPVPTAMSREARLSYRVLESSESRSLVGVDLETGRHHQIRVQLASLGHPVVGDLRYGASAPMEKKQIALMARELVVNHPVRGEAMVFRSPIPLDWPWALRDDLPAPPWNWSEFLPLIGPH